MTHFDKDSLPTNGDFKSYRKTALTRMAGPYDPPVTVQTREGEYLSSDEPCFIALDADGYPYPVAQSVLEKTYELAESA